MHSYLALFIMMAQMLTTVTINAAPTTAQTASRSNRDRGDSVSEIKEKTEEVANRLSGIDRWNTAQIVFIIVTAFAACGARCFGRFQKNGDTFSDGRSNRTGLISGSFRRAEIEGVNLPLPAALSGFLGDLSAFGRG